MCSVVTWWVCAVAVFGCFLARFGPMLAKNLFM